MYIGSKPADKVLTASDITDGIVSTAKIADTAITNAKLNADIISADTALGAAPADTDELLVSDAGVLKRMDYSYIKAANTPNFWIYKSANQSIATATATAIAFDTAVIDTATGLGSNKWTVPSGQGGTYFLSFKYIWSGTWDARIIAYLKKNGSSIFGMQADKERVDGGVHVNGIVALSAADYLEGFVYQDSGSSRDIVGGSLWNALSGFKLI